MIITPSIQNKILILDILLQRGSNIVKKNVKKIVLKLYSKELFISLPLKQTAQ